MKYTKDVLEPIVKESTSLAEVQRRLGIKVTGGSQSHIKRLIEKFELDSSHFLGMKSNSGTNHKGGSAKKSWRELLVVLSPNQSKINAYKLRRAMLEYGYEYRCESCNLDKWNDKPITLEIDHKSGDNLDNRPENLRFLCPNCHSQTENYGSKNKRVC